ncbi:phage portal protein [Hymenobacter sp. BT594]|uniref:Phage portal protein n=1 Tax=Hymenobacter guriensis TaxID=2793065 RepID=A0ABS0KWY9_9BACT|nr:phage portal protein [Hymenobacter guriensis]
MSTEETNQGVLGAVLGFGGGVAGVSVNERTALSISAIWAGVNNISQDIAGLPCQLFRKTDAGIEPVTGHRATRLLNLQASALQNSFQLRQSLVAQVLLRGNAYGKIERDGRQSLAKIHFKHPGETEVRLSNGRLWYKFNGDPKLYADYEVIHLRGLSLDGVMGVSVLTYHRETIGKGLASSRSQTRFYENGTRATLALEIDKRLSKEAAANLRESYQEVYGGVENTGKPLILEEGMKARPLSLSPADAQYIEQAKLTRSDICAILRMPPHKIGDLERSTNNNIEQQSLDYVGDTLMPWLLNFEQEYRLKLLRTDEVENSYFRHNITALLRADATARATYYGKMLERGVYSINEVRALEERNGIGPAGDERFIQVNMMPLSRVNELTDAQIAAKGPQTSPKPTDEADPTDE